jgi:curli production assembly/transport component CsgF
MKNYTYFLMILLSFSTINAFGEELKYEPINPNFGGNPFNGAYLLNNGTAQRQFRAPRRQRDPVEDFSNSISSSLLNKISREISDQILGEDAADS